MAYDSRIRVCAASGCCFQIVLLWIPLIGLGVYGCDMTQDGTLDSDLSDIGYWCCLGDMLEYRIHQWLSLQQYSQQAGYSTPQQLGQQDVIIGVLGQLVSETRIVGLLLLNTMYITSARTSLQSYPIVLPSCTDDIGHSLYLYLT